MKSIFIHAAKDLRVEETEIGQVAPGQVEIELLCGGICGSDLHYYQHGGFGPIQLKEPMILGHEVSGKVVGLGEKISKLEVGDLVAVSPSRPCHECSYCKNALYNHCENMRFYGSAMPFPHIQGAFRQRLVADEAQCVVSNGLTSGEAAMAEPLSVCLHAAQRAGDLFGKRVLVTGSGPIGTLCVIVAKTGGAAEVVVTDLSDAALKFAEKVGADRTINVAENAADLSEYEKGKGYFDVLFECSGSQAALAGAIALLKPRSIIMQLGLGGDMTLPMQALTAKELELRGSFRFHEEFETAVQMMVNGTVDVKPLISHAMHFSDAVNAFELAGDRSKAMKVQLEFN